MFDSIPDPRSPAAKRIRQDFDTLTKGTCFGAAFKMACLDDEEMAHLLLRLANKVRTHIGDLIHDAELAPEPVAPLLHEPPNGPYLEVYVEPTHEGLPFYVDGPGDSTGVNFATPGEAGQYVANFLQTQFEGV